MSQHFQHEPTATGFGNYLSSEARHGALPEGQNSPQQPAHGLYAEQLSGSAFTQPRADNRRVWLYRIRPSVCQGPMTPYQAHNFTSDASADPNPQRWSPLPLPSKKTNFIQGCHTWLCNPAMRLHLYACNQSMQEEVLQVSDGEWLIVPVTGDLCLETELGLLQISPKEIAVIPRGVKFKVTLRGPTATGYICENQSTPFRLPELGPIGANGLANPRDFIYPQAAYQNEATPHTLYIKYQDSIWTAPLSHNPLDVVAWHGNHLPYKYDLTLFNTINTVSFDHPDPSIFTVLTAPSHMPGVANIDFVIFPPRWMVAEHTFRPPYFHRNVMSEYMGLIEGIYDAKADGFLAGGGSLHNQMTPHGPDSTTFEKARTATLKPMKLSQTMAFMFESCHPFALTKHAYDKKLRQKDYIDCWSGLTSHYQD